LYLTLALIGGPVARGQEKNREEILQSAAWKTVMSDLEEWSSVQKIYDADQLAELKQQLEEKVAGMSAKELSDYLVQLQAKVTILNSPEAREARRWLDATLEAAAPAYAKKVLAEVPDVANLTAAQLQGQLDQFAREQAAKAQRSADFSKFRQQQAKQVRDDRVRTEQERAKYERAAMTAPRSNYNFNSQRRTYKPLYQQRPAVSPWVYGGYPWVYGGYRW
jgi:hypothetical protein